MEPQVASATAATSMSASFREEFCLPFLLDGQNPDGGWGYGPGSQSGVELTCWALLAIVGAPSSSELQAAISRGNNWLRQAQMPDGSWPAFVGQHEGCWVTALACLALHAQNESPDCVARGLRWLCNAWPREGGFWWRLGRPFFAGKSVGRQNNALRGWSWTPGTSSWVEPTAYSLILLRSIPEAFRLPLAVKRRRLGEAMLYDRMCPGGGWNCGNPVVYGVPGEPQVVPTVWALLALRDYPQRTENQESLHWLERSYERIRGPGSLALAHLCLETYERSTPPLEPALQEIYGVNQLLHNLQAVAWAVIALASRQTHAWLRHTPREMPRS